MNIYAVYAGLLGIMVVTGIIARRISAPTPLLLVVAGMLLSLIPDIPQIQLEPGVVFNIFLPLLVYEASAFTPWRDVVSNKRIIALLSIGHVLFITVLVACVAFYMIPGFTWPFAFVLGAVISPPDDVAVIAVADKIGIPRRIVTILSGEGLLNDATALITLRIALLAAVTHQFSLISAVSQFFAIVIFETLYGVALGWAMGELRLRIKDPFQQITLSLLTPFIAYLPAVSLGGSGVLATVVCGLVTGHFYLERFTPEVRLLGRTFWKLVDFFLQSILFLLVGLDLKQTLLRISSFPPAQLAYYGTMIVLTVIIGRFVWVFPSVYAPRLRSSVRKQDPVPWQYAFLISWAGMRGGISLAAALIVPSFILMMNGTDLRDLLIFLVFCVITATLVIQGLSLPWVLRALKIGDVREREQREEKLAELKARLEMADAVLNWLNNYTEDAKSNPILHNELKLQHGQYAALKRHLQDAVKHYDHEHRKYESPSLELMINLQTQITEVEREALNVLWRRGKISLYVKTKLTAQLDMHARHIST